MTTISPLIQARTASLVLNKRPPTPVALNARSIRIDEFFVNIKNSKINFVLCKYFNFSLRDVKDAHHI